MPSEITKMISLTEYDSFAGGQGELLRYQVEQMRAHLPTATYIEIRLVDPHRHSEDLPDE